MHYSATFFLLPAVISAAACPVVNQTRCNIAAIKPEPASYTCGTKGSISKPSVLQKACTSTILECRDSCINTPACDVFGWNSAGTQCTLYNGLVRDMGFTANKKSTTAFYNRNCFNSTACPPPVVNPPACANQFFVKAGGLNTTSTRYIGILEYSINEFQSNLYEHPWSFRLDNKTGQLLASESCRSDNSQRFGCFDATRPGLPTHIYTTSGSTSPQPLFMGVPSDSTAQNVTCVYAGTDGKTLNCVAASSYTKFAGCYNSANGYYPLASLGQNTGNCLPFTAQIVCPLPATCGNTTGFYLQTQGAQSGTQAGKWVQYINTQTAKTLQVTTTQASRTAFKFGDPPYPGSQYAPLLDAATGDVAYGQNGNRNPDGSTPNDLGYSPIVLVPTNGTAPDGYSQLQCMFWGEELYCYVPSYGGDDFAVANSTNLELGYQNPSQLPIVGLKVFCI